MYYCRFTDNIGGPKRVRVYVKFPSLKSALTFIREYKYLGGILQFNEDGPEDGPVESWMHPLPPFCLDGKNHKRLFREIMRRFGLVGEHVAAADGIKDFDDGRQHVCRKRLQRSGV